MTGAAGALTGRSAVVTGASRGIGEATVRALSGAGCRVIGVSRSGAAVGPGAADASIVADLTDGDAITRAVQDILGRLRGAPDLLVNNAGTFAVAAIESTSPELFTRVLALNLAAPFQLVRAFLPGMRRRGRGHVVTVGSVADHVAFPENGAYSASKFGVRGVHEVLRAELRGSGIRATLVSPAAVDTTLWDDLDPAHRSAFPKASEMLTAEDVADAILYAVTRPAEVNIDEMRISTS